MSIEKAPTSATTPKALSRADASHAGKGKGSSASAADDGGGAGFLSILGALGDAAGDDAASMAQPADALPTDTSSSALPLDASALLQQNPQIAAAQAALLAAHAGGAGDRPAPGAADALALDANALSATGALPADASAANAPRQTNLPGGASAKPGANAAPPAAPASATAADLGQDAPESLTQALQHAAARSKAGKEAALAGADGKGIANNASSAPQASEQKDSKLLQALEQARTAQVAKGVEPVLAPLLAKAEKPAAEKLAESFKSGASGYAGTALGVSAPEYSATATPVPTVAPEMQVAEQVTYWVSHNVQNAEMQLDGLGKDPVQVSISMQGNEAQISFRSDEAATRGVLENAANHLKDLLQREGVVLSGVSVGTSGSGDTSGNERRARQAARQGLIVPVQVATVPSAQGGRRVGTAAGRSVDLFV